MLMARLGSAAGAGGVYRYHMDEFLSTRHFAFDQYEESSQVQ